MQLQFHLVSVVPTAASKNVAPSIANRTSKDVAVSDSQPTIVTNGRDAAISSRCSKLHVQGLDKNSSLAEPLLQAPEPLLQAHAPLDVHLHKVEQSDILFRWVEPALQRGRLKLDDIWALPSDFGAYVADSSFQQALKRHSTCSLAEVLCHCFLRPMLRASLWKLAADIIKYLPPVLLSSLLQHLERRQREDSWSCIAKGYALAVALPACNLLQAVLVNIYYWENLRLAVQVKTALAAALCRRALRYRLCEKVDAGQLVNLLSSDCGRVNAAVGVVNMIWSSPLQILIALTLLWRNLGPSVLAGAATMFFLLPLQMLISRVLAKLRQRTAKATDRRLKRTEASVGAMQAVKLQCWERLCEAEIDAARREELNVLRREAMVKALNVMLMTVAPTLVSLTTFYAYALTGEPLRASDVFSALALFNLMRAPLSALPDVFSSLAHCKVALQRLHHILRELDTSCCVHYHPPGLLMNGASLNLVVSLDTTVLLRSASFSWQSGPRLTVAENGFTADSLSEFKQSLSLFPNVKAMRRSSNSLQDNSPTRKRSPSLSINTASETRIAERSSSALRDVSIDVRHGQVVAIVGSMGSGKSTLLVALLGELYQVGGDAACTCNTSYCGQSVYLTRGTLRDNVIFGRKFDALRFRLALEACALTKDIAGWPKGEETELGDKGVAISGGQQARVALARAIYAESELCLLDDPLASLDPQTSTHVWSHAVRGAMRKSAVIITTTSVQEAMAADSVVLLESGDVLQHGPPAELAAMQGPFADWLANVDADARSLLARGLRLQLDVAVSSSEEDESPRQATYRKCAAGLPVDGLQTTVTPEQVLRYQALEPHELPESALRDMRGAWESGRTTSARIDISVYRAFAMGFGGYGVFFVLAVVSFGTAQMSIVAADCWLARWSSLPPSLQGDVSTNLLGLGVLALLAALLIAVQAASWPLLCLTSSASMHQGAMRGALRAPLGVKLMSAPGQLLSRFSKDLDMVDSKLPSMLSQALTCVAGLLCSLTVIVASSPFVLPLVLFVVVVFRYVVKIYRPVAAESNRLISVLHAPVVSHLTELVKGREYVRAFGQEERLMQHGLALLEGSCRTQIFNIGLQRWLALRLELLGAATALVVSVLAVTSWETSSLGLSGLSLTYTLTLTALAKYLVNYGTRADAQFASVERLHVLTQLPKEEGNSQNAGVGIAAEPPLDWPSSGLLVLKGFQPASYTINSAPTLRPLTITVRPAEHVALIGRSGAGKSTLLAGLTRLLPLQCGSLQLDGLDASSVGLSRWRASVHCIPQKPLLLVGSIGHNLDPYGQYQPSELWEALKQAGLDGMVQRLPQQLDTELGDQSQLSTGEQQLLVLARLLLVRKTARLVLLDEPAAGMEQHQEARLHTVLNEKFPHAAAITITHRLIPLIHLFSRVLVFADGTCTEDGAPEALLGSDGGHLHELFKEAPARVQAHTRRMLALRRCQGLPAVQSIFRRSQQAPERVARGRIRTNLTGTSAARHRQQSMPILRTSPAATASKRTTSLDASPRRAARATIFFDREPDSPMRL